MVASVLIALLLGGLLWFFWSVLFPAPAPLPMVDISVSGKVNGFLQGDIRLSVPKITMAAAGAFVETKERRVNIGSISSVTRLDPKTNGRNMASVSDIKYNTELIVYGKTSDLENGVITADKIEGIK